MRALRGHTPNVLRKLDHHRRAINVGTRPVIKELFACDSGDSAGYYRAQVEVCAPSARSHKHRSGIKAQMEFRGRRRSGSRDSELIKEVLGRKKV